MVQATLDPTEAALCKRDREQQYKKIISLSD
jgi:hypothetical protein